MEADRPPDTSSHTDHGTFLDCGIPRAQLGQSSQCRPHAAILAAAWHALAAGSSTHPGPIHWLMTNHWQSSLAERSVPGADVPPEPCDVVSDVAEHAPTNYISPHLCDDLPSLRIATTTTLNFTVHVTLMWSRYKLFLEDIITDNVCMTTRHSKKSKR